MWFSQLIELFKAIFTKVITFTRRDSALAAFSNLWKRRTSGNVGVESVIGGKDGFNTSPASEDCGGE